MIIDTHCHLEELSSSTLARQLESTVLYITMGTSHHNWLSVLNLSRHHSNIFPALGLHPWFVSHDFSEQIEKLSYLLKHQKVVAIGEIGLDFSKLYSDTKVEQLTALALQLELAELYTLPVSLHVYKAHNETLNLLKKFSVTGVVHGFNSSIEVAKQYLDLGFKLGVNGVVVGDNARRYHSFVKALGVEALVVETDAPNIILPNCDQSSLLDIHVIINKISKLTGLPESEVVRITTHNVNTLFKL